MPNFLINVTTAGVKGAARGIKKLSGSLMSLSKVAMVGAAGGAVALGVAMKKTTDAAAKFDSVNRAFTNLSKSAGFSDKAFGKFSKAVDGTVNSIELMEMANSAMLLGITDSEDQMAKLFDQAQRLSAAVGQDARFGVESLVTGIGRQSKLMLDNLGIMVDTEKAYEDYAASIGKTVKELTDQERKTAFANAAIKEADKLVASLGEENLTTRDKFAQLKTTMVDTSIAVGTALTPAMNSIIGSLGTAALKVKDVAVEFGKINFKKTFENMKTNMGALQTLIISGWKNIVKFLPDIFRFTINKIIPIAAKVFKFLADSIFKIAGFLFEPIIIAGKIMGSKIANFFIGAVNKIKEIYNSMASFIGLNPLELTPKIDIEGMSVANAEIMKLFKEGSEDNIDTLGEFVGGQLQLYKDYAKTVIVQNEEIEASEDKKNKTVGKGGEIVAKTAKATTKITKESAVAQGLSSQSALGAIRSVIKAKFAEMMAGLLAKEISTKGFLGVLLGAGFAGAASALFENIVPKFAAGADFVTAGPQLMMVGDNAGGQERVQVTPLSSPNIAGPQGSGSITVNVSGNVLTQDFVEEELAGAIRDAARRGTDFGIS